MQHHPDVDVRIILEHQHAGGAYVASPEFSQYPFCWLRDGSFIAHSMDRAGASMSSRAFHRWAARAVLRAEVHIRDLIARRESGGPLDHAAMPPARFTLGGAWEEDDWPNFQLDGYGQWLWSLERHAHVTGELEAEVRAGVIVVADYLAAFWDEPCYDAWEEGRTQHHTSTLASVCAGLAAASRLLTPVPPDAPFSLPIGSSSNDGRCRLYKEKAEEVWRYITERCVSGGHFIKAVRNDLVDASLLWLATPFDLVPDDDATFTRTLRSIEAELLVDGGLMRYRADTFYGGGAWVLLTAWLAWHHGLHGRPRRARELLDWIERQRFEDGSLPEQVVTSCTDDWFHRYWTERWGPSARPLLWSHAMTLLAKLDLGPA